MVLYLLSTSYLLPAITSLVFPFSGMISFFLPGKRPLLAGTPLSFRLNSLFPPFDSFFLPSPPPLCVFPLGGPSPPPPVLNRSCSPPSGHPSFFFHSPTGSPFLPRRRLHFPSLYVRYLFLEFVSFEITPSNGLVIHLLVGLSPPLPSLSLQVFHSYPLETSTFSFSAVPRCGRFVTMSALGLFLY